MCATAGRNAKPSWRSATCEASCISRKRLGASEPAKPLVTASTDLPQKISAIEEETHPGKLKSREDELNYPQKSTVNSATCKMPDR